MSFSIKNISICFYLFLFFNLNNMQAADKAKEFLQYEKEEDEKIDEASLIKQFSPGNGISAMQLARFSFITNTPLFSGTVPEKKKELADLINFFKEVPITYNDARILFDIFISQKKSLDGIQELFSYPHDTSFSQLFLNKKLIKIDPKLSLNYLETCVHGPLEEEIRLINTNKKKLSLQKEHGIKTTKFEKFFTARKLIFPFDKRPILSGYFSNGFYKKIADGLVSSWYFNNFIEYYNELHKEFLLSLEKASAEEQYEFVSSLSLKAPYYLGKDNKLLLWTYKEAVSQALTGESVQEGVLMLHHLLLSTSSQAFVANSRSSLKAVSEEGDETEDKIRKIVQDMMPNAKGTPYFADATVRWAKQKEDLDDYKREVAPPSYIFCLPMPHRYFYPFYHFVLKEHSADSSVDTDTSGLFKFYHIQKDLHLVDQASFKSKLTLGQQLPLYIRLRWQDVRSWVPSKKAIKAMTAKINNPKESEKAKYMLRHWYKRIKASLPYDSQNMGELYAFLTYEISTLDFCIMFLNKCLENTSELASRKGIWSWIKNPRTLLPLKGWHHLHEIWELEKEKCSNIQIAFFEAKKLIKKNMPNLLIKENCLAHLLALHFPEAEGFIENQKQLSPINCHLLTPHNKNVDKNFFFAEILPAASSEERYIGEVVENFIREAQTKKLKKKVLAAYKVYVSFSIDRGAAELEMINSLAAKTREKNPKGVKLENDEIFKQIKKAVNTRLSHDKKIQRILTKKKAP